MKTLYQTMEQTIISSEYLNAVKAIKQAILESRYRAARHVNREVLALYYWVGNYVSVHSRTDAWNTNAIHTISKLLQQELPGLSGFSETNIKNMRIFYEAWNPVLNRQLLAADLDNESKVTYRTSGELPPRLRNALPDIEELKKLMSE